ncbi:hypothetical protein M438DRAFT_410245 [Aureobasidium pullulans EXF-150]|uniref:Zn(2)-C6 fungal-type domain-containing protein n=1 Tax=Aureobasidium pullulans EXF-150 TaxID=1043002 RepID=A0A074XUV3_AURPU|nr:uncharacterized protein M438DRAFT_410245 [Aureobasidium pullulans EXF-150]KEQ78406.1 hypothetical protein M438DRAFT_410245 [Aureobasidium pullulans EXF-150]
MTAAPSPSFQSNLSYSNKSSHTLRLNIMSSVSSGQTNSRQGKRAACDRCRAQKLRCMPGDSDSSGKCERCAKAKVDICSFGVPKPTGRPPVTARPPRLTYQNTSQKTVLCETMFLPRPSNHMIDRSPPVYQDSTSQSSHAQASLSGHVSYSLGHGNQDPVNTQYAASPLNNDMVKEWAGILPTPQSNTHQPHPQLSTFEHINNGLVDTSISPDLMNLEMLSSGSDWTLPTGQDPSWACLTHQMPPESRFEPSMCHQPHLASATILDRYREITQKDHEMVERGIGPATGSSTPSHEQGMPGSSNTDHVIVKERNAPGDFAATQRHCMQQLSELNMALYELVESSDCLQRHMDASSTIQPFPCGFAGRVLQNSECYLALLRSYQNDVSGVESECASPYDVYSSTSTDDIFFWETGNKPPPSNPNINLISSSFGRHERASHSIDTTTILQLAGCYLRLRQVHDVLYTTICKCITIRISEHERISRGTNVKSLHSIELPNQGLSIFADIQLGDMSLREYGRFQIKFVLQVSTHLLGEIETVLGLPENCRVSKIEEGKQNGILNSTMSSHLIEALTRNSEVGRERNQIASIRERLLKLRSLLKGTINI